MPGDDMNSKDMLTSVLHTVQMGQAGIQCVQDHAVRPGLKIELQKQLEEYDAMETKAKQLARDNKWILSDIPQSVVKMSSIMSRARLLGGERDSKIAGMLIQGNTRGMILGMKNLRQGNKADENVRALAQQLIEQERTSIENTEKFL